MGHDYSPLPINMCDKRPYLGLCQIDLPLHHHRFLKNHAKEELGRTRKIHRKDLSMDWYTFLSVHVSTKGFLTNIVVLWPLLDAQVVIFLPMFDTKHSAPWSYDVSFSCTILPHETVLSWRFGASLYSLSSTSCLHITLGFCFVLVYRYIHVYNYFDIL